MSGQATFYFDVISPWAYLVDVVLRREPLAVDLQLQPVLFAGLLNHFGHKGPAEIDRKRQFTYELATWTAQQLSIPFRMPAVHPFNPIRYLRLILACGSTPQVVSSVFDVLYTDGTDPESAAMWRAVLARLGLKREPPEIDALHIKAALRQNTEAAATQGVFGVPTLMVENRLFWGLDSLPMLRAFLRGDPLYDSEAMRAARDAKIGARR
jgi:2-hydroxychromene-2-carboxylate isomerase